MKVSVELYSENGDILHAKGEVELDAINGRTIVERNGHQYAYRHNPKAPFPAKFEEVTAAYAITEF